MRVASSAESHLPYRLFDVCWCLESSLWPSATILIYSLSQDIVLQALGDFTGGMLLRWPAWPAFLHPYTVYCRMMWRTIFYFTSHHLDFFYGGTFLKSYVRSGCRATIMDTSVSHAFWILFLYSVECGGWEIRTSSRPYAFKSAFSAACQLCVVYGFTLRANSQGLEASNRNGWLKKKRACVLYRLTGLKFCPFPDRPWHS